MNKKERNYKEKEFIKLYLSGKYTQVEISKMINVSAITLNKWVKEIPATQYNQIRKKLAKELNRLSSHPEGNEELIFKYIEHINILDTMIRKAKFLPKI